MEEALTAYLLAPATGIAAILESRLTWNVRDQGGALPCGVLTLVDRVPVDADEGETGLTEGRLQVDAYAADFDTALAIGRLFRAALSGVAAFAQGGVSFRGVFMDSERHGIERVSGEDNAHRVSQDYQIWTGE